MAEAVRCLTKSDAARALVNHHLRQGDLRDAFDRLRSVQFDPIAPVGCNHDLVLRARVPGYKVGDWQGLAYTDRHIYDGWDKQACLIPFSGWGIRRVTHRHYRRECPDIFDEFPHAVDAVLRELADRGPLLPKEFEFQERKDEWKGTWYGPNLTKQALKALWHTGDVMTHSRKGTHHVYDLAERVVPPEFLSEPELEENDALAAIFLERTKAMGLLRTTAPYELWSFYLRRGKHSAAKSLVDRGAIVPVEVEGMKMHCTPDFFDLPQLEPRVTFVAPLDQIMWDRKAVAKIFGFDYLWEIYVPEHKRRWGYYVLPVLYGGTFVARVEFHCRNGLLEMRRWLWEPGQPADPAFWPLVEEEFARFCSYARANSVHCEAAVDKKIAAAARAGARSQ